MSRHRRRQSGGLRECEKDYASSKKLFVGEKAKLTIQGTDDDLTESTRVDVVTLQPPAAAPWS